MAIRDTKWLSLALFLLTLGEIVLYFYVTRSPRSEAFTYIDDDHPNSLAVSPMKHVSNYMQNTVHYQLSTPEAEMEWELLSPREGIVHLGPHRRPFMLSMFHQLRCLDVIRHAIVRVNAGTFNSTHSRADSSEWPTRHCMNYIRQTIMCRANTRLESATGIYELHNVVSEQDYVCRDWRVVYDTVKRNHREYDD
ncbi:hypothetical protein EXIGLDRAFT_681724 [Exidia glandulosa HHB12029]|uniref:Uncharacterized protein n=1 Tax=Exidia glandulosa HHB12029 TaxID=1314781 RepID=A0A165DWW0_EXIGL|nr:hypothetical protein EXIGLDRAFT_681724 [Exidia glandulosa HHB12029]